MSSYGYAPPPPPPAPSSGPSYGQNPNAPYSRGGGSNGRGRGGHYPNARSEYKSQPPPPHYEHSGQHYPQQPPASYNSYPPAQQQWSPEHGHPPPQHAHAHAHPPAPIASSTYHPSYPPQPYTTPSYPQQPPYGPPQPYTQPYPPASVGAAPPQHWSGQGHVPPAPYGDNRSRGGYHGRGGSKQPQAVRYEHEPPAVPVNGYAPSYPRDAHASQYPPAQYYYSGPPPPPPTQSSHRNERHGHNNNHGRRGGQGQRGRGRGGHGSGDRGRHHQKSNNDHGGHHSQQKGSQQKQHQQPKQNQGQHELPIVGRKKKRKTNTLGLTPGMESESEDDEGEEEALEKLLGQEKFQVDDLAEFIAERKRNFPTKARREAKKAAEAAQKNEEKRTSLERQADKLRRQLRKVESSIKRKREQGDEGDEMRDPSSDESSDDDKPEEISSRPSASTSAPPPAAQSGKRADVTRHCKYFSTGGTCGKKSKCRFVHDPAVRDAAIKEREANNGRLTIQQRLILNDKEQEDLTILASIQYLREKGVMTLEQKRAAEEETQKKTIAPVPVPGSSNSLLPAAPPSLPAPPVKREPVGRSNPPPSIIPNANTISAQGLKHYQGWLLKPYGSSSTKGSQNESVP